MDYNGNGTPFRTMAITEEVAIYHSISKDCWAKRKPCKTYGRRAHRLLMRMNRMGVIANRYISSVEIISCKDLKAASIGYGGAYRPKIKIINKHAFN